MTAVQRVAVPVVGDQLPPLTVRITRADLVRYAGASTDFNPIHWSDRYAAQAGLPSVIGHGMLTMATALRVVTDWVGDPARVAGYAARFTKPVVVPDDDEGAELRVTGTVTAVDGDLVTVAVEAVSPYEGEDVKVLGAARATVWLGERA